MSDMAPAIVPKSDQLNADDLIVGPKTIKITGVTIRGGQEQPVSISFEGDQGKPYKACKSMCRVMVSAWGADSNKYVGRSMTLYRDPSVKYGGMEVGGIRISHMSDIDSSLTMSLTVTRQNKKPFTVKRLETAPQKMDWNEDIAAAATLEELGAVWSKIPASQKAGHASAKDARKAELMNAASEQKINVVDAIAKLETLNDLEALSLYADSLDNDIKSDDRFTKAYKARMDAIKGKM